jgi:hypothetical protein
MAILFSHPNPNIIAIIINNRKYHDWLVDDKLSLHLGKTESILFAPHRKLKSVENSSFSIECKGI